MIECTFSEESFKRLIKKMLDNFWRNSLVQLLTEDLQSSFVWTTMPATGHTMYATIVHLRALNFAIFRLTLHPLMPVSTFVSLPNYKLTFDTRVTVEAAVGKRHFNI